jgi:Cu(I)/Ag(I) efflux system membrane protein CusA/SilA
MIAVSLIVLIFLFHWRSALVILIQLPISVAIGFILLEAFGYFFQHHVAHRHRAGHRGGGGRRYRDGRKRLPAPLGSDRAKPGFAERLAIIAKSCKQVGPGVFFSTIVTVASFLPVFLLSGMEGQTCFHRWPGPKHSSCWWTLFWPLP